MKKQNNTMCVITQPDILTVSFQAAEILTMWETWIYHTCFKGLLLSSVSFVSFCNSVLLRFDNTSILILFCLFNVFNMRSISPICWPVNASMQFSFAQPSFAENFIRSHPYEMNVYIIKV